MRKAVGWIAKILFPILSIAMIVFIFYHSSMDADASSSESGSLLEAVNSILSSLGIDPLLGDWLLRKAAHFAEFFALGTFLFFTMKAWLERDTLVLIYPAAAGVTVAFCDEFIQLFSQGRSCEFKDALLDTAGVLLAVVIWYLLLLLYRKLQKNIENKKKRETEIE